MKDSYSPDSSEKKGVHDTAPGENAAPSFKKSLSERLLKSPFGIMEKKISWRLATTLFLTLLMVEMIMLTICLRYFENHPVEAFREIAPLIAINLPAAFFLMILIAAFVSSVMILALSKWLLEPVSILQQNLLYAAHHPENPHVQRAKVETSDEVGTALQLANDLIRQNSHNLRRLKSQAEDKIHRLAYYDTLTDLPNRTYFLQKLSDAIKRNVVEEEGRLSVICLDIDHFKDINDTMGHEFGDRLLEAVGKRLVKALPVDSVVCRASGDEFAIMTLLSPAAPESAALVERISAALAEPIGIMQERFQVRVSMGVAHCPDDGSDGREVMKNADIALNRAKEDGRDTVRYYSEAFDTQVKQRFQMLRDLRTALDQNQLQLHYHPQFDMKTGVVIGVEALLRWWRPDNSKGGGNFVPPLDFIPLAEESGLIVPIGEWVLRHACATNKKWQEQGLPPFRIAVNISGVQFHRADLVHTVKEALKDSGLEPRYLELEVTESIFMENVSKAVDIMNQLHRLGVELAIDDFGTGYSSLNYLRQFPIDRLKIDQSFIRNALTNPDDKTIAKTIITLGHSLNLKVMAEGVETQEHEDFLKAHGCDEAQGFKYSKPIPADLLRDFVINHTRNLAKTSGLSVVEKGAAS